MSFLSSDPDLGAVGGCLTVELQKVRKSLPSHLVVPSFVVMARIGTLLLGVFACAVLCHSVLGYVELAVNKKTNLTVLERADQFRRTDAPLGGGYTRIGYYFVELQVGSQIFRVDIVRAFRCCGTVAAFRTWSDFGTTVCVSHFLGYWKFHSLHRWPGLSFRT